MTDSFTDPFGLVEIRDIERLILDAARHWRFHPGADATLKMLVDRLDAAEKRTP
jgi:hypothetical protein